MLHQIVENELHNRGKGWGWVLMALLLNSLSADNKSVACFHSLLSVDKRSLTHTQSVYCLLNTNQRNTAKHSLLSADKPNTCNHSLLSVDTKSRTVHCLLTNRTHTAQHSLLSVDNMLHTNNQSLLSFHKKTHTQSVCWSCSTPSPHPYTGKCWKAIFTPVSHLTSSCS